MGTTRKKQVTPKQAATKRPEVCGKCFSHTYRQLEPGYYFEDETWSFNGPFATLNGAKLALERYMDQDQDCYED